MLPQSMKIMEDFQVRKSKKQKEAFRAWLCGELEAAGCAPKMEGGFTAKNVVAGDPDTAKVIFSAHYDTCAVLPIPNFITPRNLFFYICYQMLFLLIFFRGGACCRAGRVLPDRRLPGGGNGGVIRAVCLYGLVDHHRPRQ